LTSTANANVTHPGASTSRLRRLAARIPRLPPETRGAPPTFTPVLVAYVGLLAAGAVTVAALTVRLPADPALLALGACANFVLAATSVRALSGTDSYWSASIFADLGLTFVAGPIGALVAVASEWSGARLRLGGHWFKSIFNTSDHFLSDMTGWVVFHGITGGRLSLGPGLVAGLTAGLLAWLVNIWLLAIVQRLTQPGLRVLPYVGQNAVSILPYHLGAGVTAFGGVVLVAREGADGFMLLLVPVLLLQFSLLVLSSRTHAAQLQREAHARERELLLRQALEASDAERHRIARNLHDGVVQDLAAIALGLRSRSERDQGGDRLTMLHAADATSEAIDELRTLLREIAPPDLQEIGLTAALDELAEPLRAHGIEAIVEVTAAAEGVRGGALTAAYRIAQEGLRNVGEHAHAARVRICADSHAGHLDLQIADDGAGFSEEERHRQAEAGHIGLRLILDLARDSGGELVIQSAPHSGTTLRAHLPIGSEAAQPALPLEASPPS
jgi:signal transduction histidine kinase